MNFKYDTQIVTSKKECAVIGLFHKEAFFTTYWKRYYGSMFGNENLFLLGDVDYDPFFAMIPEATKVQLNQEYFGDHGAMTSSVIKLQKQLLETYETVILAEADEFILPNPEHYSDLKDFLLKNKDDYFRPQGYNIIQKIGEETSIDPRYPMLSQRKYWYKHGGYQGGGESKMLIVRKPVEKYEAGFHWSVPSVVEHPDLINLHCSFIDVDIANSRRYSRFDTLLPMHPLHWAPDRATLEFCSDEEWKQHHINQFNEKGAHLIPESIIKTMII